MRSDVNVERFKGGLLIFIYDNIGFRIRGAQAGYDQYVLIQVMGIGMDQLKKIGFYSGAGQPKSCRRRLKWADVRERFDVSNVLPSQHDYDALASRCLEDIEYHTSCQCSVPFPTTMIVSTWKGWHLIAPGWCGMSAAS